MPPGGDDSRGTGNRPTQGGRQPCRAMLEVRLGSCPRALRPRAAFVRFGPDAAGGRAYQREAVIGLTRPAITDAETTEPSQ